VEAVQTVANPAGLLVTVATGSLDKGAKAAALADIAMGGQDALGKVDKDIAAAGKLLTVAVHVAGAATAGSGVQELIPDKKDKK
jgi:hypothetical protein